MSDPVASARRLTDELLLPDAAAVDEGRATVVPHLEALVAAELYGLAAAEVDPSTMWMVTELLASGCLATAFVWVQHQGALRRVAGADDSPARRAWLGPLRDGHRRAGVAVSGVRPPAPTLHARRDGDGFVLDGTVPWVTGWGLVDVLFTIAATADGDEVWALVDPVAGPTLSARPLPLVAADASATVHLTYRSCRVPADRVVRVAPYVAPPATDGGGRLNGSLALGVARRACASMGDSSLDGALHDRRAQLDTADEVDMASARAAAAELALRATARLVVVAGGAAAMAGADAARLSREAVFTAVFGSRRAIRRALLTRLDHGGAGVPPPPARPRH